MAHLTGKTKLRLAAVIAALCLSIFVTGCVVAPPAPVPPEGPTSTALPIAILPTPASTPIGELEIRDFAKDNRSATLEIAAAHTLSEFNLNRETWKDIKNRLTEIEPEPAYLEYALVLEAGKGWRFFYAEPPTGIITTTQVQVHVVQQWQENTKSLFESGPIFKVASSTAISPTAPTGTRVKLEQGIELINAAMEFTPTVGGVRDGETAFLLLTDGNSQTPNYTLVVLALVQADGTLEVLPPDPGGFKATCRVYCRRTDNRAWYCKFC